MHSFVLDALDTTGADTFSHFEVLIEEHLRMEAEDSPQPSRLKQVVPTVGTFHTHLPLRRAFEAYNAKHNLTKRRHVCISFNELRHILNLAQVMAMRRDRDVTDDETKPDEALDEWVASSSRGVDRMDSKSDDEPGPPTPALSELDLASDEKFNGPKMVTFDGDQTLYSDGANFESNPRLAHYLYLLLKNGVTVAVVTAAGYEYVTEKYEFRLSGLLAFFKEKGLSEEDCERFYLFGGECNYLLHLGSDYKLHPVKESGPGGWLTSTRYLKESPANWNDSDVTDMLDVAEESVRSSIDDQNLRARVIRKRRAIGLVPKSGQSIPREALDESVLRVQEDLSKMNKGEGPSLPFCAFNGGRDVWLDVGNKRVGVQILQSYLGIPLKETLHIGDQFLNTGNDYAARAVSPCIWIINPEETTYILKSILRLAGVSHEHPDALSPEMRPVKEYQNDSSEKKAADFAEINRRRLSVERMDVYTGEISTIPKTTSQASLK